MKKFSQLSPGLLLFALLQILFIRNAFAQTENSRLTFLVTVGGVTTEFDEGPCGFGTAQFGGSITTDLCAPIEWARDVIGNDTLACDSIPAGSFAGKIAFIRRGACNFTVKALRAQAAGAVAVIIANNSATAAHTDCTILTLIGTDPLITIPVLNTSRQMGAFIANAIDSGGEVEVCLHPPNVYLTSTFFPVQNVQTPVTQIATDTFGFSANLTNTRGVDLTNVVLTATVETAAGDELFTSSVDIPLLTGDVVDSFFVVPGLFAPELPLGDYRIVYSTTSDPLNGNVFDDVSRAAFKVTENLFAKDDNTTNGIRPGNTPAAGFAMANLYTMAVGALDNYEVKTVEFAHFTNPGLPMINQITADVSLFRVNDNVAANWNLWDRAAYQSTSYQWVGTGTYVAPSDAAQGQIHQLELTDLNTALPGIALENGAQYVLSAFYPDSSRFAFQAVDEDLDLAGPFGIYSLSYSDQWYSGFAGGPVASVLRMYIDLVVTTDEKPLPDSYMNVFPNPAKDVINLGLSLDKATNITVTISDINGRTVYIDDRNAMTNETLTYQIGQLASGTYLARIATKEGTLTKKFIVQK